MLPGPGAAGQVRGWVMYGAVFLPARINLDRGYSGFHREHRNKEPSPDHLSWGRGGAPPATCVWSSCASLAICGVCLSNLSGGG